MAYDSDKKPSGLTALSSLDNDDTVIVGDTSDVNEVVKTITWTNVKSAITTLVEGLSSYFNVTTGTSDDITEGSTNLFFTSAEQTKLSGIETSADVTDATNVAAAGASIITSGAGAPASTPAKVGDIYIDTTNDVVYVATDTASSADWDQATGSGGGDLLAANNLSDLANAATARTNLGVDAAGTDNSTDVTLAGTGTYISIAGQVITVDPITESDIADLGAYITGITGEPLSDLSDVTITSIASGEILKWNGSAWINQTLAEAGIQPAPTEGAFADGDKTKLDGIEASADVTDTANVTSAGALMDSELTDIAAVKALADAAASDVNTGTSTTMFVTPDALAGSNFGIRYVQIRVFDAATDTATGDGKATFKVPAGMDGMNLVSVDAEVDTAGTTGTTDIQIHNVDNALDMLSTKLTIDSGETGSDTAATPAVINTSNDHINTNDIIRIDVDAVSTTAAQGLLITLGWQLP